MFSLNFAVFLLITALANLSGLLHALVYLQHYSLVYVYGTYNMQHEWSINSMPTYSVYILHSIYCMD